MNGFKDRLSNFLKEEIIFSVSFILALASCFFVKPSMDYIDYINWETILLLFAIMLVVEILKNLAVFEMLVRRLLAKVNDSRTLVCFLTFTCFFSSIFITNDVSLIVFVPFTILTLRRSLSAWRQLPPMWAAWSFQSGLLIILFSTLHPIFHLIHFSWFFYPI